MISKELLSEIVGFDVNKVEIADKYPKNDKSKIYFLISGNLHYSSINIHELAHKCKEWALSCGDVRIDCSEYATGSRIKVRLLAVTVHNCDEIERCFEFNSMIKPEHVFEYCQWVLDRIKS
jgi:hypothetical protein